MGNDEINLRKVHGTVHKHFGKTSNNGLWQRAIRKFLEIFGKFQEIGWIIFFAIGVLIITAWLSVLYFEGVGIIHKLDDSIKYSQDLRKELLPLLSDLGYFLTGAATSDDPKKGPTEDDKKKYRESIALYRQIVFNQFYSGPRF